MNKTIRQAGGQVGAVERSGTEATRTALLSRFITPLYNDCTFSHRFTMIVHLAIDLQNILWNTFIH
jgi:hypothetical protein